MNLQNKVALITGASSGIGEATAKAFVNEGAKVVLAARSVEKLNKVASILQTADVLNIPTDITNLESVHNLVAKTLSTYQKIDILINNAGIGLNTPIETMKLNDFRILMETNVFGPLTLIQAVIPEMIKNGEGTIINISSMITRIVTSRSGGYRASKLALNGISDAARYELKKYNIRVVTVFPGLTATNFFSNMIGANPSVDSRIKLRGRTPDYVARKIVLAAKNNHRELYMSFSSFIGGKFAQIFPQAVEAILHLRKKIQ